LEEIILYGSEKQFGWNKAANGSQFPIAYTLELPPASHHWVELLYAAFDSSTPDAVAQQHACFE
jgi:hypothetical protein